MLRMREVLHKAFVHGRKKRGWSILLPGFFLLVILAVWVIRSDGFYGGGDSIAHYRIARYAFRYPHLFLDHWGKPLFTLLSAPFAQLGFNGMRLYNVMAGWLAAWLALLASREVGARHVWLAPLLVVTAPEYFALFFSTLTEITFSLVLVWAVWLALQARYAWAAVVVSFLPFVRTEGFVIVLVMLVGLLRYRSYRSLPWLITGFVVYSLAGWPYYGDPFWVISQMPYHGAADIYGHGSVLHFILHAPRIFGIPMIVLWLAGATVLIASLRDPRRRGMAEREVWFVVFPALTYFAAHTFVWWRGLGSSLGLLRVMAGIVPLLAVTAVRGYDAFTALLPPRKKVLSVIVGGLTVLLLMIPPFHYHKVPMQEDETQRLLSEAARWVERSPYSDRLVFYYDLYFLFRLDRDPFDPSSCRERVPDPEHPAEGVPPGSLLQWDAHYGPNEGHLPLQRLLHDPHYSLLKVFRPDKPFKVLGGYDYAICLFLRKEDVQEGTKP